VGGTRPDLVLVHPRAGVQIIEIKDYNLRAYDFSGSNWQVRTEDGWQTTRSPFDQVDTARESLFRILLPFAEEARQENSSLYGFVRVGVYFHNASSDQLEGVRSFAERSLGSDAQYYGLASCQLLEKSEASKLIPLLKLEENGSRHVSEIEKRASQMGLDTSWQEILHGWLHPTPDETLQNKPLKLTSSQKRAATHGAQQLLITGPAGSGKTLVLARRAARRLLDGDETLLLGFNITLWHYIRDFIARGLRAVLREDRVSDEGFRQQYKAAMRRLTITHYHELAFRILSFIGVDTKDVHPREAASILAQKTEKVRKRLESCDFGIPKIDALLIDEGQDWGSNWVSSLFPLLKSAASVTISADPEQRIYAHAVESPEELFSETPVRESLDGTARVPAALLPALNVAADRWLGKIDGELEKARQVSMDFSERPTPEAIWTTAEKRHRDCVVATVREHILDGVNPSQIAVLVPKHDLGLSLESRLRDAGVDPCTLCTRNPDEDRSRKHAFWRLDPRLKLSTVHSFKGWEADVVVVFLTRVPPSSKERDLLHVALTRTRAVVQVVAPPGASDLPAWKHRKEQELLDSVPLPTDSSDESSTELISPNRGGWPEGEVPKPPPPRAPHPVERMDS
jgi:hypothetical protein